MKKNKGFVLPVGLIILLVATMIVLLTANSNMIQDKIVSTAQDREVAMQNAEKALRVAETYIYQNLDGTSDYSATCAGGICLPNASNNVWNTINWDTNTANVRQLSGTDTITGAAKQPKYIIEALDTVSNSLGQSSKVSNGKSLGLAFRVTAVAWGQNSSSKVMLQSIFVKNN